MKKTITFLLMLITIVGFSQSIDYKKESQKKTSNYFEIVEQVRQEFKTLKQTGKLTKAQQKAEKHFERWAFFWRDRVDANGNFPSELQGYYNAGILDAEGRINPNYNSTITNRSAASNQQWINIGPQTVPEPNGYPNNPQMGRLTNFMRFVKVPSSENVLFVSAPVGGIWKSIDNGNTWEPKLDFIAGIGVTDMRSSSTDANNPGTIYVSTGDYDAAHIKSIGVLKSTDFGETYQSTNLTFPLSAKESTSNLIVIDNNTVIVGTNQYIKKTTDGGNTWTNVYTHPWPDGAFGKFHRNGSNIICGDSWDGLYYSKNNGTTWSVLKSHADNGQRRHAITSNAAGLFYIQNKDGQVYTCDMSATTPTLTSLGSPTTNYNPQGAYNQALVVKDGLIISGGVDGINSDNNGGVWYTTLNNNWNDNTSAGSYGHADIHEMGPLDAGFSFWAVNDGGLIYFTYPNLSSEKPTVEYKTSGVLVTQLYSVAISPQSENHIIMGNQDNDGYSQEMHNGSLQWVTARVGDGTCTAIDYTNSGVRYVGAQNGGLIRADTGFSGNLDGTTVLTAGAGPATNAPFVWTLKMNSTIPNTLYAGLADVYKTTDKGANWTNLNSGAQQIEYIETFGNNLLVIGENLARKSSNDGSTWSTITEPSSERMNSLSLDQNNTNVIYATIRGYIDGSKVFKSTDGGNTWTNISTGLPNVKMTQVVLKQNQGANEILFAGTEIGVYVKVGASDWTKLGQGLPNVNVSDIEINYTVDKLVAATYGRGLWNISILNSTLGVDEVVTTVDETPFIYPNPVTNGQLNIKLKDNSDSFNYIMYNVIGGVVQKGQLTSGLNTLDVKNIASGIYVVRMTNGNHVSSQKVVIK